MSQVLIVHDPDSEFHLNEYQPCKEDILADDWETEEQKMELTQRKIIEAWGNAIRGDDMPLSTGTPRLSNFLKELGL